MRFIKVINTRGFRDSGSKMTVSLSKFMTLVNTAYHGRNSLSGAAAWAA
jgi:hypothetical protein